MRNICVDVFSVRFPPSDSYQTYRKRRRQARQLSSFWTLFALCAVVIFSFSLQKMINVDHALRPVLQKDQVGVLRLGSSYTFFTYSIRWERG